MSPEKIAEVSTRLESIQTDVEELYREIDAEELGVSDRQYIGRCFDLLRMEVAAMRQYLAGLA